MKGGKKRFGVRKVRRMFSINITIFVSVLHTKMSHLSRFVNKNKNVLIFLKKLANFTSRQYLNGENQNKLPSSLASLRRAANMRDF